MWGQFFAAYCFGAIALIAPGFFAFCALKLSASKALAASPLFACAAIPIICMIYDVMGVHCTWQNVTLPMLALGLILFVGSALFGRWRGGRLSVSVFGCCGDSSVERRHIVWLLGYVFFAVIATGYIFVVNLDGADSFVQAYDSTHHLSAIQTFSVSGNWSSFSESYYAPWEEWLSPTALSRHFYPSAWHAFGAMLADAVGVSATVAANVTNTLFVSLIFPCGVYLLIREMFGESKRVLACGAICAFAFAAFPWNIMWWGPIYPNFASLCAVPSVIAGFIMLFKPGIPMLQRAPYFAMVILGFLALLFLQPNSVFTCGVFLIPFLIHKVMVACGGFSLPWRSKRNARTLLAFVGFVLLVVAVWAAVFNLPAISNMAAYPWGSFAEEFQAVVNILLLSLRQTPAQPLLGLLVIVGAANILRNGCCRWAVGSYALMGFLYWVSAATDGTLKAFLTAFWYTDPMRLASNVVIAAIPLACIGMSSVTGFLARFFSRWWSRQGALGSVGICANVIALCLVMLGLYAPNFTVEGVGNVETGIGGVRNRIDVAYRTTIDNVISPEERDFLQTVKDRIGSDALVINEPNDGSALAYGVYGMNVYYRGFDGYNVPEETKESHCIRLHLDELAENPEVREAVDSIGARYVLQLDQGDDTRSNKYIFSYREEEWTGIDGIRDDTPGFEVVLAKDDMRLYRIL